MDFITLKHVIEAFLYAGVGIIILGISFFLFDKITPGELWKEIGEKNNMPLAITTAAVILGMSIIIAASIHG